VTTLVIFTLHICVQLGKNVSWSIVEGSQPVIVTTFLSLPSGINKLYHNDGAWFAVFVYSVKPGQCSIGYMAGVRPNPTPVSC